MVSEKEIEARYRERKQVIELVAIAAGLLSLVLLVLGLASGADTTVLFAVVLLGIFICCGAVALASLRKAYRTKQEQMKRTVGKVY